MSVSWRDKVTDKLLRVFCGSSNSRSPYPLFDQSQAKERKSHSSIFSSSFSLFRSSSKDKRYTKSQSLPVKRDSKSISWHDKPLNSNGEQDHDSTSKATPNSEKDRDTCSEKSTCTSILESAADPNNETNSMQYLTEDSSFISSTLYEFFLSSLPNIVKGCQWVLLYSTVKHGISLHTLFRRSADLPGPCLLIAGDKQGAVFGGLLECPLNPTSKRMYKGTYHCFVFTTIYGEPRIFRPTGANRYFYLCLNDSLALGGGSNFALHLDEDLLNGTSGPSETFGNECLAHSEEFKLKNVELWGFTHSSRYLR